MALSHRFCYAIPLGFGMCLQDAGCLCGQHWVAACLGFAGVFEVDGALSLLDGFPRSTKRPGPRPGKLAPISTGHPGSGPIQPVPSVSPILSSARNACAKRVVLFQADATQAAGNPASAKGGNFTSFQRPGPLANRTAHT